MQAKGAELQAHEKSALLVGFSILLIPHTLNGFYMPYLAQHLTAYWIVELFTWTVLPLIGIYWIVKKTSFTLGDIGLRLKTTTSKLPIILALAVVSVLFASPLYIKSWHAATVIFDENYFHYGFEYTDVIPSSGYMHYAVALFFSLSAGIVEEIYYRGILRLFWGNNNRSILSYILVSSLIFSSIHWEGGIYNLFATFSFGVFMSILYLCSKSLVPGILGHAYSDWLIYSE